MKRSQHTQMRDAINDVELALNELGINDIVRLFEGADDLVMVKIPLGVLRRLANCYPELNRIINDKDFVRPRVAHADDQLVDFAELKLLIDEYDPSNSDWNFRRGVLLDVLVRLWPKAARGVASETRVAGTFQDILIKRMNNLIETANKDSSWEMEAVAEMMKAVHLLKSRDVGSIDR